MAVSGSVNFELDVAEYVEEAFERCGLEVRTGYDLTTARRSLNLMLAEWANRGLNQWTIAQRTQALTSGTRTYALAADVIDILSAVVTRSSTDFSLTRVSRDDDLNIIPRPGYGVVFPAWIRHYVPQNLSPERSVVSGNFYYSK